MQPRFAGQCQLPVEITLTCGRQEMSRSQKINRSLFLIMACSRTQQFHRACLEGFPGGREMDCDAVAGLATAHLIFASPLPCFISIFPSLLLPWDCHTGGSGWGRVTAREKVREGGQQGRGGSIQDLIFGAPRCCSSPNVLGQSPNVLTQQSRRALRGLRSPRNPHPHL